MHTVYSAAPRACAQVSTKGCALPIIGFLWTPDALFAGQEYEGYNLGEHDLKKTAT